MGTWARRLGAPGPRTPRDLPPRSPALALSLGQAVANGTERSRGGTRLPGRTASRRTALTRALCGRWYRQSVWSRSKPITSQSAREKSPCIAEPPLPPRGGGWRRKRRRRRRKERGRCFLRRGAGRSEPPALAPAGLPSPARGRFGVRSRVISPLRTGWTAWRQSPRRGERGLDKASARQSARRRVRALGFQK